MFRQIVEQFEVDTKTENQAIKSVDLADKLNFAKRVMLDIAEKESDPYANELILDIIRVYQEIKKIPTS